jgi:hypothetical protein
MALPLRAALRSAGRFAFKNPATVFSMARHALGLRLAIPLDAVRWFIANTPPSQKAPQDVSITSRPPAIAIGATIELMGTTVRTSVQIRIDQLEVSSDQLRVSMRLSNVEMKLLGESFSPVAGLIKSGALDLSKPGNLVKFMPKKPEVVVEAHDDIVVLDLLKNPRIRSNDKVRRVLETLAPVVQVSGLSTDGDFLVVQLRATPFGLPRALSAARALASG